MEDVKKFLNGLEGIVGVHDLDLEIKEKIASFEEESEKSPLPIINQGIKDVFLREQILVLGKNQYFRKPSLKSFYMVEEVPPGSFVPDDQESYIIECGGKKFKILGNEIEKGEKAESGAVMMSENFVYYPKRRSSERRKPRAYFINTTMPFPELEERKDFFGIDQIVAGQPNSNSDKLLKERYGFEKKPSIGTLLIGYNNQPGHSPSV